MTYIYILENLLKKHLKNFSFEDGNSLLECDFLDTYSNNIAEYVDPYLEWQTVPIFYLIKYSYGINYLSPISYKFYVQSLMWNYIKNRDVFMKEINSLESWFHSLLPLNEDFCIDDEKFTKLTDISSIEGRIISYFLFCIYHDPLISNEIKVLVKDINSSFWMSRKYTLY